MRGSPPPVCFACLCCAISPLANSAGAHCARGRHRPRPPTSGYWGGGAGRREGEGAGDMTWGEGDGPPSELRGEGRDFLWSWCPGGGAHPLLRWAQNRWVCQETPHLGVLCVKAQTVDLHWRVTLNCLLTVVWEQMGVGSGMGCLLPCSTPAGKQNSNALNQQIQRQWP